MTTYVIGHEHETEGPVNPPLHIRVYHTWRCNDLRMAGGGRGGPWSRGRCICCGDEVWYQKPHVEKDELMVCWVCDPL